MKRRSKIQLRNELPIRMVELARNRTADMLDHYGKNIRSIPIEVLCASCYLQGVEDVVQAEIAIAERPVDFQI